MKKAIMFFLLMISIFFVNVSEFSRENKEVLIIGKAIVIDGEVVDEINENKNYVKTSNKQIGIITAIDKENNKYVAFGHKISISNDTKVLEKAICCEANNLTIQKNEKEQLGYLSANIDRNNVVGNVINNENIGVSGIINNKSIYDENEKIATIASKYEIEIGEATIYLDLDGNGPKEYKINIEKINYFSDINNLEIKVVDPELLEKTGGIISGMSGSPILQNDKLIGAINCVSMQNKTEGYAIFASKLFN